MGRLLFKQDKRPLCSQMQRWNSRRLGLTRGGRVSTQARSLPLWFPWSAFPESSQAPVGLSGPVCTAAAVRAVSPHAVCRPCAGSSGIQRDPTSAGAERGSGSARDASPKGCVWAKGPWPPAASCPHRHQRGRFWRPRRTRVSRGCDRCAHPHSARCRAFSRGPRQLAGGASKLVAATFSAAGMRRAGG